MKLRLYHVDAFADRAFRGNPAAVIVLDDCPSDEWLLAVAEENHLSETAYVVATGTPEDPVTGSSQCDLMPYWAARLGRASLTARQVSRRGGELRCRLDGDRVHVAGKVVPYLEGEIEGP